MDPNQKPVLGTINPENNQATVSPLPQTAPPQYLQNNPAPQPGAAAALEMHKTSNQSSLASQTTDLQKYTLLFLALLVITVLSQLAQLVVRFAMNDARGSFFNAYIRQEGAFNLSIMAMLFTAAIILLITKSRSTAQTIVALALLGFVYFAISNVIQFDIVGAGVSAFIVWRLFELYQKI